MHADRVEHGELLLRDLCRDASPEQGRRQRPSLDLLLVVIDVDAEICRVAPAKRLHCVSPDANREPPGMPVPFGGYPGGTVVPALVLAGWMPALA